jgi:cytochrome c-type biogenesis protein CcmH/NrfG
MNGVQQGNRFSAGWRVVTFLLMGCIVSAAAVVQAAAYVPASGSEVLERLPARNDPAQRELMQLRAALAVAPQDVRRAVALARRYVEIWRDGGDPRYLGYAQAALGPWWNLPQPPLAARVMRATLLQSTHHFTEALADLDAVVKADPGDAQAWLTRATVLQVLGDYAGARASCARLNNLAPPLIVQTCTSGVASLNGGAEGGYRSLATLLRATPEASNDIRVWVLTLLAEIAERRGDRNAARASFEQAMKLGMPDNYLLAAYADFLLAQHEPALVITLLKDKTQIDGLLLRYAIALRDAVSSDAQKFAAQLAQRFDAARMRGDTIHQREQARFELELAHDPAAGLKVAQENWSVQKEPADTRLLLQAAVAAHNRAAAQPLLDWLHTTHLEDQALAPLVAAIGRLP